MDIVGVNARVVHLPKEAFSVDAVKRAAYSLMARYDVSIVLSSDEIICTIAAASENTPMAAAERDFRREVVDQDLRILIEQRTENYRDTILGLAFSRTGLQDG